MPSRVKSFPDPDRHRDAVARLLRAFVDNPSTTNERVLALRPRSEDFTALFTPGTVQLARTRYEALWERIPAIHANPGQSVVLVTSCRSQDLAGPDGRRFPGGYRRIVDRLVPDVVWSAWKFVAPGRVHGMAYDGLVHLEDRWVWLPKPWKVLAPSTGLDYLAD